MLKGSKILCLVIIGFLSLVTCHLLMAQDTTKVLDGYQKFYYPSGILSSEGIIKEGKPEGYWKAYYENGKLKSEGNRKKFELDSTWKFYNDEEKLILEINYRQGKKNGIKTTFLEKEMIRENFVNDIKEGYTRYYYPDGKLKLEIPFIKGLEQGLAKEYAQNGDIITLIEYKKGFIIDRVKINRRDQNNWKQGRWYTFYENGNIKSEGNYIDDKKNGYFKEYSENGDLLTLSKYINDIKQVEAEEITRLDILNEYYSGGRIKASGTYRNGVAEGIRREYDTTGKIVRSFIYKNGIVTGEGIVKEDGSRDGHWKEFYADGSLRSEGDYKQGKPIGEWNYFYPDGKLEQHGKYTNSGKLTGNWKWYFNNGQLMLEEEYIDGEKDGMHTEYDEKSKIIEQGEYLKGLEDGPWFSISADYLERGTYRDGLKTGLWSAWYLFVRDSKTDSILSFTGNFVDDNPDGKHTYYWENGKIKDEGNYLTGKKDGNWCKYNDDGSLFLIITYRNGIEVKYDGIKVKPQFDSGEE